MMATGFSPTPTTSYVNMKICQREWGPVQHLFTGNHWRRDSERLLDTLRVLVEQGAVDPAETTQPDFNCETAISMFNLKADCSAVEALDYLLRQVDTTQFEDLEWSSWLLSPDLTVMGQEIILCHLTRLTCLLPTPFYLEATLGCLCINMARLDQMEQFSKGDLNKWRKTVFWENLNKLIDAKADQHRGFDYWTVMRLLSNPFFEKHVHRDLKKRIDDAAQMWLLWLEECGVDNHDYLQEKHDFGSDLAAYPSLLDHGLVTGKEGEIWWAVPDMVQRFALYDFRHADLNECHTRAYRQLCNSQDSTH